MPETQALSPDNILKTIKACIANGARLLEETYDLEIRRPSSTRFFLIMTAQEEFAKAFILLLIKEDIIPLSPPVRRAINDHVCKQLVGIILDYLIMHWEEIEELKSAIKLDIDLGDRLPNDVGSALEIFVYEKIGKWAGNNWVWAEDPAYDRAALKISKGKKDRRKQDALYVRIRRDGGVCSTPAIITEEETQKEFERAERYRFFMLSQLSDGVALRQSDQRRAKKITDALVILFEQSNLVN